MINVASHLPFAPLMYSTGVESGRILTHFAARVTTVLHRASPPEVLRSYHSSISVQFYVVCGISLSTYDSDRFQCMQPHILKAVLEPCLSPTPRLDSSGGSQPVRSCRCVFLAHAPCHCQVDLPDKTFVHHILRAFVPQVNAAAPKRIATVTQSGLP